jgi:hypothetical protein
MMMMIVVLVFTFVCFAYACFEPKWSPIVSLGLIYIVGLLSLLSVSLAYQADPLQYLLFKSPNQGLY